MLVREEIRQELRVEMDRVISPTFVQTCQEGAARLEGLYEAVLNHDDQHKAFDDRIKILERAVEQLEVTARPPTGPRIG